MEFLSILEKKIATLVDAKKQDEQRIHELTSLVEQHKAEIVSLSEQLAAQKEALADQLECHEQEKASLSEQVEKLENSLLSGHKNIEELSQERELTKLAVDDLIKSIDHLVGPETEQQ